MEIGKTGVQLKREADLLRELAIDFDWNAAAKRIGINTMMLSRMRQDEDFMSRAKKVMEKAIEEYTSPNTAVKKFLETQKLLYDEVHAGNLDMSGQLLKSHDMEFKMHGLFAKDNEQKKGSNVSININFSKPNEQPVEVEGVIDGEEA